MEEGEHGGGRWALLQPQSWWQHRSTGGLLHLETPSVALTFVG